MADASSIPEKSLTNKDGEFTKLVEWATEGATSIEEFEELFAVEGVEISSGEEITGDYRVVTGDEKQAFLQRIAGTPVFIVKWEFYTKDNEFCSAHIFVEGYGKYILSDSAKGGLFGQLSAVTAARIANGAKPSHAKAGLKASRGFVKNREFYYDTRTRKAIKQAELDSVPAEFKKKASPTWKLAL